MKKIIIGLMALVLAACTNGTEETTKETKVQTDQATDQGQKEAKKDEKTTEEKPKETDKKETPADQVELFKELAGKEFIGNQNSGSERLYFFEDGSFDSGGLFGNGNMTSSYLASGRFEIAEKIDESTYDLRLVDFAYESPVDTEEILDINGQEWVKLGIRGYLIDEKNIGETYRIHLPSSRLDSFSSNIQNMIKSETDYVKDGKVNIFLISKESEGYEGVDHYIRFEEVIKDQVKQAKEGENYFKDMVDSWKDIAEATSKPNPSPGNHAYDYDDSHLDYQVLADIYLDSYKKSKEGASSAIDLDGGLDFVRQNPETFVYPKYFENFTGMFNESKSISKIDLSPEADQDFLKIYGDFIEEKDISSDGFGVWNNLLSASLNSGEKILIDIDYCGNFTNFLKPTDYGTKQAGIWALPLGVYTINQNGQETRVFKFASGQGIMNAAYMHFGESYGF